LKVDRANATARAARQLVVVMLAASPADDWDMRFHRLLALVCVLAGVALVYTPLGAAAANVVQMALYAKNAGAVDGVKVSRTPKPGTLLPLDRHGKLPRSVLPVGATGPAGPPGATGASGAGTVFVDRASMTGPPVVAPPDLTATPIPLASAAWTQAAGEVDYLVFLHATVARSNCSSPSSSVSSIDFQLDGNDWFSRSLMYGVVDGTPQVIAESELPPPVMDTGTPTQHTLTASVSGVHCTATVSALSVDVAGFRPSTTS
jgi:hypothetical protein